VQCGELSVAPTVDELIRQASRPTLTRLLAPARAQYPRRGGRLLVAALGFAGCSMPSYDRALHVLRTWLDSWAGIGHVAVSMHRQGYDLQLTQYDERGWRATFYTTGMEHSPTSATGTGWERTPFEAAHSLSSR
jgi:hypothetical protein